MRDPIATNFDTISLFLMLTGAALPQTTAMSAPCASLSTRTSNDEHALVRLYRLLETRQALESEAVSSTDQANVTSLARDKVQDLEREIRNTRSQLKRMREAALESKRRFLGQSWLRPADQEHPNVQPASVTGVKARNKPTKVEEPDLASESQEAQTLVSEVGGTLQHSRPSATTSERRNHQRKRRARRAGRTYYKRWRRDHNHRLHSVYLS